MQDRVITRKKEEQNSVVCLRGNLWCKVPQTRRTHAAEGGVPRSVLVYIDEVPPKVPRPSTTKDSGCLERQPEVGEGCHGTRWDGRLTGLAGQVARYAGVEAERVASLEPLQMGTEYQV
ncbi:hypothetical protein Pcac1_g26782 [Phytophthora cactorum]|uniref:Uncharacterized protein n=1 Tax=Phytophthora cactorum TaxID=29920 RepID=A0A329S965_9STRA|nr:hypothetical protein Pcac1_g26782 [Phytophthora cactorum]KAG2903366.1 hypothetical protein PC114_g12299 [Phytophthora cactorum]KAG2918740.1 hypothetical protein PC117_g16971 [Phytophthora cactorum]KAG3015577.1 hypothetical protein PC119_g11713 [Phytophthora cactorum]KAG3163835.1 hypothetical protein C6341_g12851 [Phytophthora cactorum]